MRHLTPVARRVALYGALQAAAEIIWEAGAFNTAEGDLVDRIADWSRRQTARMPTDEHQHAEQLAVHLAAEAVRWAERFAAMQQPPVGDEVSPC